MADAVRTRIINDIRYFESLELPSGEYFSHRYLGKLFTQSHSSIAFGQLIGDKCKEADIKASGSALYLVFTSALSEGQINRLEYKSEVWQLYVAYGLDPAFNSSSALAQEARIRTATFESLKFVAPHSADAISRIQAQYSEYGDLLRVRCLDKVIRGHRIVVSFEVRAKPNTSHLWLEVTNTADGRHAEYSITPLQDWDDARFLAARVTASPTEITVHPRTTDRASYYTNRYETPFRCSFQKLNFARSRSDA